MISSTGLRIQINEDASIRFSNSALQFTFQRVNRRDFVSKMIAESTALTLQQNPTGLNHRHKETDDNQLDFTLSIDFICRLRVEDASRKRVRGVVRLVVQRDLQVGREDEGCAQLLRRGRWSSLEPGSLETRAEFMFSFTVHIIHYVLDQKSNDHFICKTFEMQNARCS